MIFHGARTQNYVKLNQLCFETNWLRIFWISIFCKITLHAPLIARKRTVYKQRKQSFFLFGSDENFAWHSSAPYSFETCWICLFSVKSGVGFFFFAYHLLCCRFILSGIRSLIRPPVRFLELAHSIQLFIIFHVESHVEKLPCHSTYIYECVSVYMLPRAFLFDRHFAFFIIHSNLFKKIE